MKPRRSRLAAAALLTRSETWARCGSVAAAEDPPRHTVVVNCKIALGFTGCEALVPVPVGKVFVIEDISGTAAGQRGTTPARAYMSIGYGTFLCDSYVDGWGDPRAVCHRAARLNMVGREYNGTMIPHSAVIAFDPVDHAAQGTVALSGYLVDAPP